MRFLVDESTGPSVARWLRKQGHQVFSIYDESRGITDVEVIQKAWQEEWILITNDKDFGDKVYRENQPHRGIVLLRLSDERWGPKIATLKKLLSKYADRLADNFVVATETRIRFARKP
jgi:predicted nuclease of predicted toxin-antitoxin system